MRTRIIRKDFGKSFAHTSRLFRNCAVLMVAAVAMSQVSAAPVREPNVTMQLPADSPPFPYVLENALPGIELRDPVVVVTSPLPGDANKLFVLEEGGRVILINNIDQPSRSVFLDISDRVAFGTPEGEGGLLGMAFHPNYAVNGHVFIFYVCSTSTADGSGRHDRLSRFTRSKNDPNRIDASSELVLFTQFDQEFNHNAGSLLFGADGYLYLTVGDEGYPDDVFDNSQRIDRDFFGGVLRIDVDKKGGNLAPNPHPALAGSSNYSVPADNPYVGATSFNGSPVERTKVRTEFWAVGLRSPWRMSRDAATGNIYVSDVGEIGRVNNRSEEINLIVKGGNYGWPYFEADAAGPKINEMPPNFQGRGPLITYDRGNSGPTVGRAAIGGVVYRGSRLEGLNGAYIFGDYFSGNIWALRHSGDSVTEWRLLLSESQGHIVSFGQDPRNGDIFVCDIIDDQVKRLVPVPNTMMPPPTLADAGVFANLQTLEPNPGIVPYDINVSFWSDGAEKRRWFSIPDVNQKMTYSANGNWDFPAGMVWIKHFDLNGRKVETRLLVRTQTGTYGASYEWDDGGGNAYLVESGGKDKVIDGQVWHYPGRNECGSCHTPVAGHALGFNTAQMNRGFNYGGGSEHQIRALAKAGYFNNSAGAGGKAMVAADNNRASLDSRVKSYLAANCAQCHQPNGPARTLWDARFTTPMSRAGIVNGAALNVFGNPAYRIVAPRSPENSLLLQRIASTDHYFRMPPIASTVVDQQAVDLVTRWINSLPARKQPLRVRVTFPRGSAVKQELVSIGGTAAGDNLAKVLYTVNDGPEQEASGALQWSADIALQPGVNKVAVYAMDGAGNMSRPARRIFKYKP